MAKLHHSRRREARDTELWVMIKRKKDSKVCWSRGNKVLTTSTTTTTTSMCNMKNFYNLILRTCLSSVVFHRIHILGLSALARSLSVTCMLKSNLNSIHLTTHVHTHIRSYASTLSLNAHTHSEIHGLFDFVVFFSQTNAFHVSYMMIQSALQSACYVFFFSFLPFLDGILIQSLHHSQPKKHKFHWKYDVRKEANEIFCLFSYDDENLFNFVHFIFFFSFFYFFFLWCCQCGWFCYCCCCCSIRSHIHFYISLKTQCIASVNCKIKYLTQLNVAWILKFVTYIYHPLKWTACIYVHTQKDFKGRWSEEKV